MILQQALYIDVDIIHIQDIENISVRHDDYTTKI